MSESIASTPEPPYFAVIFTSVRSPEDGEGYEPMAERMVALAATMPGFLGVESARAPGGLGITVSYWRDEASIAAWKHHGEHLEAQRLGHRRWYEAFALRVARVERQSFKPGR